MALKVDVRENGVLIADMNTALSSSGRDLSQARADATSLEDEYSNYRTEAQETAARLQAEIDGLRHEIDVTTVDLESAHSTIIELRNSAMAQAALVTDTKLKVREAEVLVTQLRTELGDSTGQLTAALESLVGAEAEVNNLEYEHSATTALLGSASDQVERLQA